MAPPSNPRNTLVFAILALALFVAGPAGAEPRFSFDTTPGKLPKDVQPLAYRIDLVTDLDALTFTGKEEVDINVDKPTDTIVLNAVELAFADATLKGEDAAKATVAVDEAAETASLHFPHALSVGHHTLAIAYSGKISARPAGIYYADYDMPAGRKRMLVTQFEATDARRMFPGWDEPSFKATFTLSAVLPASFRAVSNTPILHEEAAGANKKVTFATTPKMSSYLLVLVAGEMDRVNHAAAGADVGVDAVKGKGEQGRYALDGSTRILPYYNDYFGVKYPLPKLDLIAIPGNFAAGAMENWGGITYIDNDLLFDPASSSESTRQLVFQTIAHEMAHQWSGDLVTMAWWDNIWLNEGFASWMATKATDHFNPTWKVWLRSHADVERAMAEDSRATTHPIQRKIADESEADSAFDDITYLKGQAFIRMTENYLGEATFRDGMRRYMKAHAYSNSTTADFWAALEEASGKPVAKIAAGFTEQPGIPLIHVDTQCVGGDTVATLTEDRFTIHDPAAAKLHWEVPVAIGRPGDAAPRTLLVGDAPETVKFAGCNAPMKANFGDVGYYRVQYSDGDLKALGAAYRTLTPADRVNLLGDAWAMVEAGRADPASYLDLLRQIPGETELAVWTQVIASLRQIDDRERGSPDRGPFRAFARELARPILDSLGWDPKRSDTAETPLLRALAIGTLGRLGDASVIAEAQRRFAAFLENPKSLSPGLQDAIAIVVGHDADRQTYDALRKLGRAASSTETRLRYYNALAGASDPALIADTVKITETDELPNGRVNRFIGGVAGASDDPDLVWKLFLANHRSVFDRLTGQQRDELLPMIARASSDLAVAAELKAAPESNVSSGARHEADKAVEEIAFKADFKKRLLPAITTWIKAKAGG